MQSTAERFFIAMYTTVEIKKLIAEGRINEFYSNDRTWRRLSKEVRKEQHNECWFCRRAGRYSRAVLVHHRKPVKLFPELAYERYFINEEGKEEVNLVGCCFDCHEIEEGRAYGSHKKKYGFTNQELW